MPSTTQMKMCLLILLDLSAAFDTVNHPILICTLESQIEFTSLALQWFSSYLFNQHQFVHIGTSRLQNIPITCGATQVPYCFLSSSTFTWSSLVLYSQTTASRFTNMPMIYNSTWKSPQLKTFNASNTAYKSEICMSSTYLKFSPNKHRIPIICQ